MLKGEWRIPWDIIEMVEEILHMLHNMQADLYHTFKEGNQLADYLADHAIEQEEKLQFLGL